MTPRSSLATWVRSRTPSPPDALVARLDAMVSGRGDGAATVEDLVASAEDAMRTLLSDGCLTRSSALDLLAIDALITYAFEAAADEPERLEMRAERALASIAALTEPYQA